MQNTIISIIVFIFGAIIGSFLNVVILRFRSGKTLKGRSMCFTCGKTLTWTELIPLGSFLTQRGRCMKCKTPISWQYPLVEAITGFLFVFLFYKFVYLLPISISAFTLLFGFYALVICPLIVLSVYDMRHQILPDELNIFFIALAFLGLFVFSGDTIGLHLPTLRALSAGILLPAPFYLLWVFSKGRLMGLGDVKLMVGIGFLLGLTGGLSAILLAFWIGAGASILWMFANSLLGKKKITMKSAIPFGPYLVMGTLLVLLSGFDLYTYITSFY